MQGRIESQFDQAIEDLGWERIRSRLEVATRDGREIVHWASEDYRGGPHNPLSDAEVEGKFRDCAEGQLDEAAIGAVFDQVWRLDDQGDATAVLDHLDWRSKRPAGARSVA